jgi:hypothetical protein
VTMYPIFAGNGTLRSLARERESGPISAVFPVESLAMPLLQNVDQVERLALGADSDVSYQSGEMEFLEKY